ncbi:MAG: aryl-sulfate sulfotransferase [Acidobacteriota bacterium]
MKGIRFICLLAPAFLVLAPELRSGTLEPELVPDLPSGQLVGTTITWTVTATSPNPLDYRFSVAWEGGPVRVMYDFRAGNQFQWTPIEDGNYSLIASVRDLSTGQVTEVAAPFVVDPRALTEPVVTPTNHPLVALYSARACSEGNRMKVFFIAQTGVVVDATSTKPCRAGHTMNFYVAGMRAGTLYNLRHEVLDASGQLLRLGPRRRHLTGIPTISFPTLELMDPWDGKSSLTEEIVLMSPVLGTREVRPFPFATDRLGRILWFYDREVEDQPSLLRPVAGGTLLIHLSRGGVVGQVLREVDLAGEVVRETTAARISEQLLAMGFTDTLTALHHEGLRLSNGHTLLFGYTERIMEDVQGPGPVDIVGDYIVDLDENWQVAWAWNAFEHMDVTRAAVLGETCRNHGPGCAPILLDDKANDWLHSNAIDYSPVDGNLLVSMRHQDWIVKIDYQNGTGSGDVLWRLGPEGDFILDSGDPFPWFTHQHDPNYVAANRIVLFDNGNTRCAGDPALCFSRGQSYTLDEAAMTASLVFNVDLGNYSSALGSAQLLLNGNYHFNSGLQAVGLSIISTAEEVLPDGTLDYALQIGSSMYRSFRMTNLYTPDTAAPQQKAGE